MHYISVIEAAQQWGISSRQVQRLLSESRIPGAKKHGRAWMIPADIDKPEDLRKDRGAAAKADEDVPFSMGVAMPLLSGAFEPGRCHEMIEKIKNPDLRQIALAEYWHFCGQPERTLELSKPFLDHEDPAIRLSALLLHGFASLPKGDIQAANQCIQALWAFYRSIEKRKVSNEVRAAAIFFVLTPSVLLHMEHPGLPALTPYVCYLPEGLQLFGYYICAHAVYLRGDYGEALGIAKSALYMHRRRHTVAEIYLRLVMCMALMNLKRTSEAQDCFMEAWEIARPDGLFEGFGEHHGLLQGLIESCLKRSYPKEYEKIIAITYQFSAGWRKVHNPVMNKRVADNLTTMEFTVAMLANRGWTNMEIADYLVLSQHTVKKYISDVYVKLGISSRKELYQYMLK